MARWLIQLEGDVFDLEEFPRSFPDGDVYVIAQNGKTYITGPAFEGFADASKVREAAIQSIDEFSAVISLLWPSVRRPSIGHVFREHDDGHRESFVFVSERVTARDKTSAILMTQQDGSCTPDRPTQAQQLLAASRTSRRLQIIISIWADPIRTWPRLYRILEELEEDLGGYLDEMRLCSRGERTKFTRSANTAEIAGKDARHRDGKYEPPKDPLTLEQAAAFIERMLIAVIRRKAS